MNGVTNEDGKMTFVAAADLERGIRIKIGSALTITAAGLNEAHDGVTLDAVKSGKSVTCKMKNAPGTVKIRAASAFSRGAELYSAADGKVDDAASGAGAKVFKALEAATAADDLIECLPRLAETV